MAKGCCTHRPIFKYCPDQHPAASQRFLLRCSRVYSLYGVMAFGASIPRPCDTRQIPRRGSKNKQRNKLPAQLLWHFLATILREEKMQSLR